MDATSIRQSIQEIQDLKLTYQEQIKKGKKHLWKRVSDKMSRSSRNSRRQAIQYKWKNYCRQGTQNKRRICKDNTLVQIILAEVPFKGYQQLSKTEPFLGISQSDIKNTYYSAIRSLARFIQKCLPNIFRKQELNSMLNNRNFLKMDSKISLNIIGLRRDIHSLKMGKAKLDDDQQLELREIKETATTRLKEIGQYYHRYVKSGNNQGKMIRNETVNQIRPIGAQFVYKIPSLQINQDFEFREPLIQDHLDQQISILSSAIFEKNVDRTKIPFPLPSFSSIFNDF